MKKFSLNFLAVFFVWLATGVAHAATVECEDAGDAAAIRLSGAIAAGDYQKIVACMSKFTEPDKESKELLTALNKKEPGRYEFVPKFPIYMVVTKISGSKATFVESRHDHR